MTDVAEKVRFLSRLETYGPGVESVEVRETHMSWVFLTGHHVYKLKKPVTYPHLDFSTIEKRRRNCGRDRRLARAHGPPARSRNAGPPHRRWAT
jgi:aminoglycoside phosphotransferase family enzyme